MPGRMVAVTQRIDEFPDRDERRDALDQALIRWLSSLGLIGLPVSNAWNEDALQQWLAVVDPAGVVLSGGNDIGACPERDAIEASLLDWARHRNRPVLGICRGMQMMAKAAGGNLKAVSGHVRSHHRLGGAFGTVNSFHDIGLDGTPPGYEVLACAEDGEIEAMRHRDHPFLGWMWHPERETPFDPAHTELARQHFNSFG